MKSIASVHRFGDQVAVYVGDGSTTYLTAKQARAPARALRSFPPRPEGRGFPEQTK